VFSRIFFHVLKIKYTEDLNENMERKKCKKYDIQMRDLLKELCGTELHWNLTYITIAYLNNCLWSGLAIAELVDIVYPLFATLSFYQTYLMLHFFRYRIFSVFFVKFLLLNVLVILKDLVLQ
jgi:thiosulfate reductase cytochrome b subunit